MFKEKVSLKCYTVRIVTLRWVCGPGTTASSAGATVRRTRQLPRALAKGGAKNDQKYKCVMQEVTNICQVKVNRTHVHADYEKIKVLHYLGFGAEGTEFLLS